MNTRENAQLPTGDEPTLWNHIADDREHYELLRHLEIEHSIAGDDVAAYRREALEILEFRHVAEHAADQPDGLEHDAGPDGTCSDTCVALHPDHEGTRGDGT